MGARPYRRFGIRLQQVREEALYTQEELAGALGVSPRTLRRWEAGEIIPDGRGLVLLCQVLSWDAVRYLAEVVRNPLFNM